MGRQVDAGPSAPPVATPITSPESQADQRDPQPDAPNFRQGWKAAPLDFRGETLSYCHVRRRSEEGAVMQVVIVAAASCLAVASCSSGQTPLTDSQLHQWALDVATEQARILTDIPPPGPDSADEPRGLDLRTSADITFTYWAPAFVISIMRPRGRAAIAVKSEIQFQPSRMNDPHKLPVRKSWTSASQCSVIAIIQKNLENVLSADQRSNFHSNFNRRASEMDGGGYTVRASPSTPDGISLEASGNDISEIGVWAAKSKQMLQSCWQPLD